MIELKQEEERDGFKSKPRNKLKQKTIAIMSKGDVATTNETL